MTLFNLRSLALTTLTTGALALANGTAPAQFMAARPGSSFYFNQRVTPGFTGFGSNYGYNFGFRINHVNPVTGQRFTFNWHEGAFNAPPGFFGPSVFNPNFNNPYMNGGYGYNYNGYNGYPQTYAGSGGNRPLVPYQNQSEKGAAVGNQHSYEQGNQKSDKPSLQVSQLLDPTEDHLLSGDVHNQLIALIRKLEAQTKVESPILPGGLTEQIEYTGGPAAGVLTLLKGGKPAYPAALETPENLAIKLDLESALNPLLEALLSGKAANQADATKMNNTVASAKKKLAETVRNLPINDGMALTRFLNGLEGIAKVARDPKLAGAYQTDWKTIGPSVSEFIKHLDKFQLQIAPAMPGEEEAYSTLHRGLASYYMDLTQKKK